MEHGGSQHVKVQSRRETTIEKTVQEAVQSDSYIDIEVDVTCIKEEPGLVELLQTEPGLSVKEEALDHGSQDGDDQLCVQGASTSAILRSANVVAGSANLDDVPNVKHELHDADIGPTVLQQMDIRYRTNQEVTSGVKEGNTISNDGNDPAECTKVKGEIVEVESRGSEPRIYICDYCQKTFTIKSRIIDHIASVHVSGSYKCSQCDKRFTCKQYLKKHMANVHTARRKVCNVCGKSLRPGCLRQHMRNMHSEKRQRSKLGGETTRSKQYLRQHLNDRHGQQSPAVTDSRRSIETAQPEQQTPSQSYSCDKCDKIFTSKQYFWQHCRYAHLAESHKCNDCDKEFKSKYHLYRHTTNVHSKQQYKCDVCKKICKSKPALHTHVSRLHRTKPAGSEPSIYICEYCQRTFTRKTRFADHITRVHTNGSHKCSQCNKTFKCNQYLTKHVAYMHTARRQVCSICGESVRQGCLGQHMINKHSDKQLKCKLCGETLKSKQHLHQHLNDLHGQQCAESHRQSACRNLGKDLKSKRNNRQNEASGARATVTDLGAVASTSKQQHDVVATKEEPADGELELNPVVFQHMDCNYRPFKQESQLD